MKVCFYELPTYMRKETELAWAAGFFDGEGSCTWHKSVSESKKEPGRFYGYLSVDVSQVDPRPLYRFHEAVEGLGNIYGPYKSKSKRGKDYYRFTVNGPDATRVIQKLFAYLSEPKKEKINEALAKLEHYRQRPKLKSGLLSKREEAVSR